MREKDKARESLIQAAIEILGEERDPGRITVRRLAERAGVGVGLLNYHFGTKEALLNEAVGVVMKGAVEGATPPDGTLDPMESMVLMLQANSDLAMRFRTLTTVSASYELHQGQFRTALTLLPLLRGILGQGVDETGLRLKAFQIVYPLQLALTRPEAFLEYSGIDINDAEQRNLLVRTVAENVLKGCASNDR